MISKIKVCIALVSAASLLIVFQNCSKNMGSSNQFSQSTTDVSDGLDTEQPNNKPVINCRFGSQDRNSVFANISSLQDSYSTDRFNEDDRVSLDCGNTNDESSIDALTFEIDTDYDVNSPNFSAINPLTNLSAFPPGRYDMALRVTDPEGESSVKIFSMEVECTQTAAAAPVLSNPSANVSVVEGSNVGQYNFSVNTSALSNGDRFEFAWDFNGDGVMDPFAVNRSGSRQIWTSNSSVNNQYVNVENTRPIRLSVMNECLEVTSYEINKDLDSSHAVARTPSSLATDTGYYYLQGDARNTTGSPTALESKRRDADYLATDNGVYHEFSCDFNRNGNSNLSTIRINTSKRYRDEDYSKHGSFIHINNIADDGSTNVTSTGNMQSISYTLAGESDGLITETFSKVTCATVDVRIIRSISSVPCSDGSSVQREDIQFMGEFNCSELTSNLGSDTIEMQNGKFFCGDSIADRCSGGGGGGGGQPPPQF